MTVGACLVVEGERKEDKRYGRQFATQSWEEELPATTIGIETKKICIIVGTTKALAYSIHNMVVQKRNTRLKERLSQ